MRDRTECADTDTISFALGNTILTKKNERELARRGRIRLDEARERIVARAAAGGEARLLTTIAMVRKEMSRKAVELMQAKASQMSWRRIDRRASCWEEPVTWAQLALSQSPASYRAPWWRRVSCASSFRALLFSRGSGDV